MECGKHDILPVAGAIQDHAQLPVTMPRESDSSMCLDGSTIAQTVPSPPSMSPEECTARPDSVVRLTARAREAPPWLHLGDGHHPNRISFDAEAAKGGSPSPPPWSLGRSIALSGHSPPWRHG